MLQYAVVNCTDEGIERCLQVLRGGGVIVFPTDTVYGIGCDPFNDSAVARIFGIKSRSREKQLPVLLRDQAIAENFVNLGPDGRALAEKFWPGPLTIVAPLREQRISQMISVGSESLGVRVPAHRCTLALLTRCHYLVGTSANVSGGPSSKSPEDIRSSGLEGFDVLLDGGKVMGGVGSTVYDIQARRIIRKGVISEKAILETLESGVP